jgi:Flp pilus assembly protein TadD/peroxiredoxin
MNNGQEIYRRLSSTIILPLIIAALICLLPINSDALIGLDEGDPPKNIELRDVNGVPVNVNEHFGERPVIIVFWEQNLSNSFINYSLDVIRFLNDSYEKYHESAGLEVFGVYTPVEENAIPASEFTAVRNLIKINKIKFPVLIDRGFDVFRDYGVVALPSTIMVNKKGKIEFIYPSFPLVASKLFTLNIEELVGIARPVIEAAEEEKGTDTKARRLYQYALQMYKKGLLEQALSPLKKSIALEPDMGWSRNLMGIILWKSGNFESAVEEFKVAIKIDRRNAQAHFNYGLLLFESGKLNEAEKQLDISMAIDDSVSETHYVLGLLYKKKGRFDEAVKNLRRALSIYEEKNAADMIHDPASFHRISAYYELSELYAERGDLKASRELLRKAARAALSIDVGAERPSYRSEDLMIYE